MDIQGETDSNIIIVGDLNIPGTVTDRSPRQIINKEVVVLNDTLDQIDLIDIFRVFHSKAAEYTFFSSAHGASIMYRYSISGNTSEETRNTNSKEYMHPCVHLRHYLQ